MKGLAYTTSLVALMVAAAPAAAQDDAATAAQDGSATDRNEIVVTATRRAERLQDVPLSVTAFDQAELTQKGIVGYEELARQTPGAVLNQASANNSRLTARGISTNGWGAGLQTTTTIYLDELPLTTIGNSVTLNPAMYDVERVEFLRGPQGTLFGSGSLSGALRVLTRSPDLRKFDVSGLADIGLTPDGGGARQRYNAMVNAPLVEGVLGLRVVGFYRNEEGYVDNIGTGVKNSNTLNDWGGRATLLFRPTNRLSIRLMAFYEDSEPRDSSLITPSLGDRKRYSIVPDAYTSRISIYNGTLDYQFDGVTLTSSTTYSAAEGRFDVDLAGTFPALNIPFILADGYEARTFVQETRLASDGGGLFDFVVGGFYMAREIEIDGEYLSTQAFLTARGITGLPNAVFSKFGSESRTYELAGFGELTFNPTDKISITGGLRYGKYGGTLDTRAGYNTAYFTYALFNIPGPLALTPTAAATLEFPGAARASWKGSIAYRPNRDLTLYGTVSTGYRTPVYNGRAGSVSIVNPADLVIPPGAGSDNLTNYELGMKGRWFDGKLSANIALYYIDWRNIQVQANRQSDSVQFSTNIGGAASKGVEVEILLVPSPWLTLGLNGSLNDARVTKITAQEAIISGAVPDARLASPHVQGSFFGTFSYDVGSQAKGFTSFQLQYVDSFPNGFPNVPGTGAPSALYGFTDSYAYFNIQTGVTIGEFNVTLYAENLGNSRATTYIHPEAFVYSRYAILRPRTFGIRLGYNLW